MPAPIKPSPLARVARGRMPDFFIVGHAKCGTTALYEMLRRHPQVYMSDVKESQFFARDRPAPAEGEHRKTFEQTGRGTEKLEDYLSLFTAAREDQRVGDASTFHLWSPVAAQRIAEAQPAARIVAVFREPASFLRSLHLQMLQNHTESEKDLGRALELEEARREGREIPRDAHWPAALIYSERVHYVEQLRRYNAVFPAGQMLVLIYDDFRDDNEATVRRVLRFLEVDDTAPIELVSANPTVGLRSVRLDTLTRDVRGGRGAVGHAAGAAIKALTTATLRRRLLYPLRRRLVYERPAPVDEQLMRELRRRFKPEVVALSEYLDRDLVRLWGYDKLD
jgi:hypothetical protein